MKKIEMTLTYFIQDNQILLPLKKKKIGKGKHNGVGGRLEANETHEQAMIRECIEEVGLEPVEYEYMAELSCNQLVGDEKSTAVIHVYICKNWTGDLIETDEMKPYWFDINDIPYDKTMDDNKYWLPLVLDGKKIVANFDLNENYVTLNHDIKEIETLKKVMS
jgi:8-oxo-dGTP pyrophosphatase MutT (NUDIX family)